MAERAKVCTDRVLPRELMRLQRTTRGPQGRTRAISPIGKTWMNGSTLRVRFIVAPRPSKILHASRPVGGRRWPISSSTSTMRRTRKFESSSIPMMAPVVCRHRLAQHPRQRADDESRLSRWWHCGA